MAAPTISVVVPCFNHVGFVAEAVDSALAQQPPPLEVIVVDDGSTDGSLEILRGYGHRIVLLTQQRGRQARGRNLGLRAARGDLVAFLDSDDRFLPGRLAAAAEAFARDAGLVLSWGDFRCIDTAGRVVDEVRWRPPPGPVDYRMLLLAGNPICNASVTVRRDALLALGGFDERLPRACDGHAWARLAAAGARFAHCARTVVDYRLHDRNDSRGFAAMSLERDAALRDAVAAALRGGALAGAVPLRRARAALLRQFAFNAAADVDLALPAAGPFGPVRRRLLHALGSDAGQRALAGLHALRWVGRRRSRP